MQVILSNETEKWNEIIAKFPNADIYYLNEYIQSLLLNTNDKGVLFFYQEGESLICAPMIIKDIANDVNFKHLITVGQYFDMEVPYGYGGPLVINYKEGALVAFNSLLKEWCVKNNVISQFLRFHPLINNANINGVAEKVVYSHHTVSVDTIDKELLFANMDSKKRNMIRKAVKNGVAIEIDEKLDNLEEFKVIYNATMQEHNASDMYYFGDNYYQLLKDRFLSHTILFIAKFEGKPIAASLFFYDEKTMHYHLSGKDVEYRNLAATDLLLYQAMCWASERGIKEFHLGGGLAEGDSLYMFKKGFNKFGDKDFYIGRSIFDVEKYNYLLNLRAENNPEFCKENSRLIQYRR